MNKQYNSQKRAAGQQQSSGNQQSKPPTETQQSELNMAAESETKLAQATSIETANVEHEEGGAPLMVKTENGDEIDVVARLLALESLVARIVEKVHLNDKPVQMPQKRNYNPDYLPSGGPPRGLDDLPAKSN